MFLVELSFSVNVLGLYINCDCVKMKIYSYICNFYLVDFILATFRIAAATKEHQKDFIAVILTLTLLASGSFAEERVITDLSDTINGVPVDYSYNETFPNPLPEGYKISVPGCPNSEYGHPWVYYGTPENARCYLVGLKGPCPFNQVLIAEEGSPFGFCTCECFKNEDDGHKYLELSWRYPDKLCDGRAYKKYNVHVTQLKQCFSLFEQGPCEKSEWLVADIPPRASDYGFWRGRAFCEQRKCPEWQYPNPDEVNQYKNKNVTCIDAASAFAGTTSILPSDCSEDQGERYSNLLQKCVRKKSYDLRVGK